MLLGERSDFLQRLGADGTEEAFRAIISGLEIAHIAGAGHMMHIEKPDLVAARVESFLSSH
jgi:pimeloyl-ACP methyl ester carboxylesterase